MAKYVWNASVIRGAPLYAATVATTVDVYDATTGSRTQLWADQAGTVLKANPFTISSPGKIQFYANEGRYNIVVTNGGESDTWDDELIGPTGSGGGGSSSWGSITGTLSDQTDLQSALDAKASASQTDGLAGYIETVAEQDYRIAIQMPFGGTITSTTTQAISGTCTATFKINSTSLGGTANSVSSSEQEQAHASSNTFSAGDNLVLTLSSNSSCTGLSFMVRFTRTLS